MPDQPEDRRPWWIRAWEDVPMTEDERKSLLEAAMRTPKVVERLRRFKRLDETRPPIEEPLPAPPTPKESS